MLASLQKANQLLQKELNDYLKREADMKRREEALEVMFAENKALKDEIQALEAQSKERDMLQKQMDELDKRKKDNIAQNFQREKQQDIEFQRLYAEVDKAKAIEMQLKMEKEEQDRLHQTVSDSKMRMEELLQKLEKYGHLTQEEEDELNRLKAIIIERETEIEDLKRRIALLNQNYKKALQEQSSDEKEIAELLQLTNEKEEIEKKLLARQQSIRELESKNQLRKKQDEENKKNILQAQKDFERLKKQNQKLFESSQQKQTLVSQSGGDQDKLLALTMDKRKIRIVSSISLFLMITSIVLVLASCVITDWDKGFLVKPMNFNPNLIDNLPNVHLDYSSNSTLLGTFERGLFYKCEYLENEFSSEYYHKVAVQLRTRKCNDLPLKMTTMEQQFQEDPTQFNEFWQNYTLAQQEINIFYQDENDPRLKATPDECDDEKVQISQFQEFDLNHFSGCAAHKQPSPVLIFIEVLVVLSLFIYAVSITMNILQIYDPPKFCIFMKLNMTLMIIATFLGLFVTIIFGPTHSKLFNNDTYQSLYKQQLEPKFTFEFSNYYDILGLDNTIQGPKIGLGFILFIISWIISFIQIAIQAKLIDIHYNE